MLYLAILANHFHVILRNGPDVVATWTDREVAGRRLRLCPVRYTTDGWSEIDNNTLPLRLWPSCFAPPFAIFLPRRLAATSPEE